jgi:hypothetical protein
MPGGRTAHSRFKIPLTLNDKQGCGFTKQYGTAKLLQQASLIIWDEASMTKRQAMEALDYSMRDIMGRKDLPFGGRQLSLVEISGKSSLLYVKIQGSNCRCFLEKVVSLGIHATS